MQPQRRAMTDCLADLIHTILDTPIRVDRSNIESTVIADKYISKSDVCNGIPAGTGGVC